MDGQIGHPILNGGKAMCQHSATNHNHVRSDPATCHTPDGFTSIVGTDWTDEEVDRLARWDDVWGGDAQRPDPWACVRGF